MSRWIAGPDDLSMSVWLAASNGQGNAQQLLNRKWVLGVLVVWERR